MDTPVLPFELILEIATYLDQKTLNALIQTHRRASASLTNRLYDLELFESMAAEADRDKSLSPTLRKNYAFEHHARVNEGIWACVPTWKSGFVVDYFVAKYTGDLIFARTTVDRIHVSAGEAPGQEEEVFADDENAIPYPFLHLFIEAGNAVLMRALIERAGADLEVRNQNGETPLIVACASGKGEIVEYLLEAGADLSARDNRGLTPLGVAIRADRGDLTRVLVEKILRSGGNILSPMQGGNTTLHVAARWASEDLVEYFINTGADIEAQNDSGQTPLHYAVGGNKEANARLLIRYGADPCKRDNSGTPPLEMTHYQQSAHQDHGKWVPILLQGRPRDWPEDDVFLKMWHAAANWDSTAFNLFVVGLFILIVRSGLSPLEALDDRGLTGLHFLCVAANSHPGPAVLEMMKILLDAGADPVRKASIGFTPFQIALIPFDGQHGQHTAEILRFLLEYPRLHGRESKPLDYDGAVKILLEAALRIYVSCDIEGESPIEMAVDSLQDNELATRVRRLLYGSMEATT